MIYECHVNALEGNDIYVFKGEFPSHVEAVNYFLKTHGQESIVMITLDSKTIYASGDAIEESLPLAELKAAHKKSFQNFEEIRASDQAACFYCLEVFSASDVTLWVEENSGIKTAKCPHCEIDSVIGDASGVELTKDFLERMHDVYF